MVSKKSSGFLCAAILSFLAACASAPGRVAPALTPGPWDGRVSEFYAWDKPLAGAPGAIMRSEDLPPGELLPGAASGQRILYSSTSGIDGQTPVAVSGAVYFPEGEPPAGGWPVVAWGHGTVGVADICAPSWAGRPWRDLAYLQAWLSEGFAVVATDYEGLGTPGIHPYMFSRSAAYSLLDSARAVLGSDNRLKNDIVLIGQSQGGGAVLSAGGYAPSYSPELSIRAVVATGAGIIGAASPEALVAASDAVDPTTAYALYIALTLSAVDGVPPERLLSPKAMAVFSQASTRCIDGLEYDAAMARLNWPNALGPDALPLLVSYSDRLNAPIEGYSIPVFMGTGSADVDVPAPLQDALAAKLCEAGAVVMHRTYDGLDHGEAVNASLSDSLPLVRDLMAGRSVRGTCPQFPAGGAE